MAEVVFKSGLTFKNCLRDMLIGIVVLGILLLVSLGFIMLRTFVSSNSLVEALTIVSIFLFSAGSFFFIIGLITIYFSSQKIARINEKGLQIPLSGYKGFFFPEQESEAGYCWNSKGNIILVSSSFQNIKNARVVTDKNEIESITTNRSLYNMSGFVKVGSTSVRIREIPNLYKGVSSGEFAKHYAGIIEEAFKYSHVNIPEKTVAIHFKELKHWYLGLSGSDNRYAKKISEKFEEIMPTLKEPVLYVSVANPVEFSNEINRRISYEASNV